MSARMTIQAFSKQSGISKSALRFYEEKGLLKPSHKEKNGYRYYNVGQLEQAKLISSLRLAGISIQEIRHYLEQQETDKYALLEKWITTLERQEEVIRVGLQYLKNRARQKEASVYLLEKESQSVIWYQEEAKPGHFAACFKKRLNELSKRNLVIQDCYLQVISATDDSVIARLGFGLTRPVDHLQLKEAAGIETMPACICLAQPYQEHIHGIQQGYQKMLQIAIEGEWLPTGPVFEWYRGTAFKQVELLLPVTKMYRGRE